MNPECAKSINDAAGRQLSKAELDAIESGIKGSLRDLAIKDRAGFHAMSIPERMTEAAKMAKENMLAAVVRQHEASIVEAGRKAALRSELDNVQPGLKGQVHTLKNKISAIESKVDALSAKFFSQLQGIAEADGGKFFGLIQDPAAQRDIAAAIFGEHSTPEAKAAGDSINKMTQSLAERFQRAGIPLHELDNYHLPQPQDPSLVAKGGKEAWVADHMNWVDRDVYVNSDGSKMSNDQLADLLGRSYSSIASDGANKRAEGTTQGGGAFVGANKNAPRQLHFKDSASWSAAMSKYGRTTNLYELVASHVRGMSKDITMAEEFGRNADQNVQEALSRAYVNDQGAVSGKDVDRLSSLQRLTQRYFDATAHPDRPGNETAANLAVQVRGLLASSQLGSLFGALPDLAGMKMAAELNGLPFIRMFRNFVDGITSGKEKQDFLHRLGVWQDGFQHASNRMAADEFKSGWGTWLNETTHRAMGLNAFDRGMRVGMGRTVMDVIGSFTRKFGTLAEAEGESRLLQSKGVTEDHWNVWKAAEVDKGRGNEQLLTPDAIHNIPDSTMDALAENRLANRSEIFEKEIKKRNAQLEKLGEGDENTAARIKDVRDAFMEKHGKLLAEERAKLRDEAVEKLLEVIYMEMQFGARGASRSSLGDRVAMGTDSARDAGTIAGEVKRFALQFKSVPIGIFRAHLEASSGLPGMTEGGGVWGSKQAYMAKFVGYSALMGALAIETKAIINGQDPRTMNMSTDEGRKFWMESIAAGGGFGMYGDLFLNGQTAQGSGAEALMGPGIGAGYNLIKEFNTAREEANKGEGSHNFALAGVRWVRKNATPFANLWYAKAAFNRLVYDQLQDHLSPGASDKQRMRMEARGASYWWAPGATSPERAPDLGRAVAE